MIQGDITAFARMVWVSKPAMHPFWCHSSFKLRCFYQELNVILISRCSSNICTLAWIRNNRRVFELTPVLHTNLAKHCAVQMSNANARSPN